MAKQPMKSPDVPAKVWEDAPSILLRVIKYSKTLKYFVPNNIIKSLHLTLN
jgi:hypothetical protein